MYFTEDHKIQTNIIPDISVSIPDKIQPYIQYKIKIKFPNYDGSILDPIKKELPLNKIVGMYGSSVKQVSSCPMLCSREHYETLIIIQNTRSLLAQNSQPQRQKSNSLIKQLYINSSKSSTLNDTNDNDYDELQKLDLNALKLSAIFSNKTPKDHEYFILYFNKFKNNIPKIIPEYYINDQRTEAFMVSTKDHAKFLKVFEEYKFYDILEYIKQHKPLFSQRIYQTKQDLRFNFT